VPEAAAKPWEERGALAVIPLEDPWAERRLVVAVVGSTRCRPTPGGWRSISSRLLEGSRATPSVAGPRRLGWR
jgi:hypothetical protein